MAEGKGRKEEGENGGLEKETGRQEIFNGQCEEGKNDSSKICKKISKIKRMPWTSFLFCSG